MLTDLAIAGGCAAKFPAARLERLLDAFLPVESANLLVGLDPADDAAVYKLDDERALVFTIDFFPPLVDSPADFGAIAAANALNDVFAMGGVPLLALSVAAFPEELSGETIAAILSGAEAKVREAGALLAGGHTILDDEPKYGLAVVGTVHPDGVWQKSTARPGDTLLLTKPLGTGLVLSGVKKGLLGNEERDAAISQMTTLDAAAATLLRASEPSAVTDVTGFGLFGHAMEMAIRSGMHLVVEAGRLPALPGALEIARRGVKTGGDARNRDYAEGRVATEGIPSDLELLGFDPQTAGGLLIAIPAARALVLEAEFRARGLPIASIGHVEEGSGVTVL
jgi:selenide,water dikinase